MTIHERMGRSRARVLPDRPPDDIRALFNLAPVARSLILKKTNKGVATNEAVQAAGVTLAGLVRQPTNDARFWASYRMASRPGSSSVPGCCRPIRVTYSECLASVVQLPENVGVGQDANFSAGAQSYAAAVVIEAPGAGRTEVSGTWSNSAVAPNTPIGRLSATASAQVQYTGSGGSRIV